MSGTIGMVVRYFSVCIPLLRMACNCLYAFVQVVYRYSRLMLHKCMLNVLGYSDLNPDVRTNAAEGTMAAPL